MAAEGAALAIVGGRVIDGLGGDPIEKGTVLIERDRITTVGKDAATRIPRDARVLDAGGRTVLPGIIDCHVHSTYRARDIRGVTPRTPRSQALPSAQSTVRPSPVTDMSRRERLAPAAEPQRSAAPRTAALPRREPASLRGDDPRPPAAAAPLSPRQQEAARRAFADELSAFSAGSTGPLATIGGF